MEENLHFIVFVLGEKKLDLFINSFFCVCVLMRSFTETVYVGSLQMAVLSKLEIWTALGLTQKPCSIGWVSVTPIQSGREVDTVQCLLASFMFSGCKQTKVEVYSLHYISAKEKRQTVNRKCVVLDAPEALWFKEYSATDTFEDMLAFVVLWVYILISLKISLSLNSDRPGTHDSVQGKNNFGKTKQGTVTISPLA